MSARDSEERGQLTVSAIRPTWLLRETTELRNETWLRQVVLNDGDRLWLREAMESDRVRRERRRKEQRPKETAKGDGKSSA